MLGPSCERLPGRQERPGRRIEAWIGDISMKVGITRRHGQRFRRSHANPQLNPVRVGGRDVVVVRRTRGRARVVVDHVDKPLVEERGGQSRCPSSQLLLDAQLPAA